MAETVPAAVVPREGAGPAVQAVDVSRVYGTGGAEVHALTDVSLEFPRGQFTAVMGASGSGKSTLMHILAGLDRPTSGKVFIDGTDITDMGDRELTRLRRDKVGFVFQAFNLLPMLTAGENITLPLSIAGRKADRDQLRALVDSVGLADRLSHRPSELSGGQQQRVAVARSLVSQPAVIFADEPTGNLDSRSSAEVLGLLRSSVDDYGRTVVMVTHDAGAAANAGRVVFLRDGEVAGDRGHLTESEILDALKKHMTRIVLRGMRSRKLRTILTALAILLGVAMIAGTFVLTDTIKVAFDQIFTQGNKGVAASITGKKVVSSRDSKSPPISEGLVARIKRVPGVAAVDGSIQSDAAQILNDKGKAVGGNAPTLGFSVPQKQFDPYTLVAGSYPTGANQVAIDKGTADAQHWKVGATILIATQRPAAPFQVTGIVKYGTLDSLGGATISLFDVTTAQSLFDRQGKFDRISVAADPGVAQQELVNRLRDAHLPSTVPLKIETGRQQTHDDSSSVAQGLSFFTYALLAFGGIAVFVGAFIIFNTFSITVAQRTREFGMLRAIGASRRQVLGSVLLEALVVGVAASLAGLGLGILLAGGLRALLQSFGIDLPHVGLVFAARTVIVSLIVGVGVTLVAGLVPAIRATRISPVAALREGPAESSARTGHRTAIAGVILVVLAAAAVAYGVFGNPSTSTRLLSIAVGSVLLFVAVAMVTPRLVPFVVLVVGWPLRRLFGLTGRLASENATRNPGRTAVTAAALMIGLGLVAFVTIFAEGLRVSANAAIDKTFTADLVITPSQNSNVGVLPLGAEQRIRNVPGIALVSPVRAENARITGHGTHEALGVDPATFVKTYRFDWRQGNDSTFRSLGSNDALMERDVAKNTHVKVGDSFSILTPNGQRGTFTLRGIYRDNNYLTGFVIPLSTFTKLFDERQDVGITANVASGQNVAAVEAAVKRSLSGVPNVSVQTRQQLKQQNQNNVNNLLGLLYALLALSIIISAFGIVNTLVLSIFERTRELGLLRAVGTSRRQVRRMIRYESVITAVLGAILGLVLGIFFAWIFTLGLSDQGLVFAVPIGRLLLFLLFAIIVGVLAAIFPARRASRLNVLDALAYE